MTREIGTTRKPSATALRQRFRAGVKWQLFRKYMLARANYTCEFCGKRYARESTLNVHHRFDTDYENLEPSRFMVVCWTCHKFIHAKGTAPAFRDRRLVHCRDVCPKSPTALKPGDSSQLC